MYYFSWYTTSGWDVVDISELLFILEAVEIWYISKSKRPPRAANFEYEDSLCSNIWLNPANSLPKSGTANKKEE